MKGQLNWDNLRHKLRAIRIPLAAFAAGILLLLIAGRGEGATSSPEEASRELTTVEETVSAEERLGAILRQIDGVGEANVLLSYQTSAVTDYVTDEKETVIISSGSGKQEGLIRCTHYPKYLGAVVVCDGGNAADVRLNVTHAVAQFTGLGTNQITVLQRRK